MWLFLFTELILFGGLFIVYAVYRFAHPDAFHLAAAELDTFVGTVNTLILLTSSLTVAMSITAVQEGRKGFALHAREHDDHHGPCVPREQVL